MEIRNVKGQVINRFNIAENYCLLYSAEVFTRVEAWYCESERQMRECLANRDNYDIDALREVVAYHEKKFGANSRTALTARAVLAERLAEFEPVAPIAAYQSMMNAATLATLARRVAQLEKALADYRAALVRFTAKPTKYNRHVVAHWTRSVRVWRDLVNKSRAELVQA